MPRQQTKGALFWAPRIITILAILFLSSLALDVFEDGTPILEMIAGFLIHLIPSFILIAILVIAWRYERLGGIFFLCVAAAFFLLLPNSFLGNLILAGPFLIAGLLFLLHDHRVRSQD